MKPSKRNQKDNRASGRSRDSKNVPGLHAVQKELGIPQAVNIIANKIFDYPNRAIDRMIEWFCGRAKLSEVAFVITLIFFLVVLSIAALVGQKIHLEAISTSLNVSISQSNQLIVQNQQLIQSVDKLIDVISTGKQETKTSLSVPVCKETDNYQAYQKLDDDSFKFFSCGDISIPQFKSFIDKMNESDALRTKLTSCKPSDDKPDYREVLIRSLKTDIGNYYNIDCQ